MKCEKCGNEIPENVKFCRFCGAKTAAEAKPRVCAGCGAVLPKYAQFCNHCGCPVSGEQKAAPKTDSLRTKPEGKAAKVLKTEAALQDGPKRRAAETEKTKKRESGRKEKAVPVPKETAKPKRKGRRLAVLLLLTLLIYMGFVKPGFLRNEPGGTDSKKTGEYKKTSESELMSPAQLTTIFPESGVAVALSRFTLEEGQTEKLSVESLKPVYDENGSYVIRPYQIRLGGQHELGDFVEIRIPYDTGFCDPGEDPAECVAGVYRNSETGEWEETLYTVDAAVGQVVIETDHFSDFGAMTVKNKGARDALLCGPADGGEDPGFLTEDQAIAVIRSVCQNGSADTPAARLAGNQILQAAMALGGAAANVSDISGTAFSMAYFLDLTDNAMSGNYLEIAPEIEAWGHKLGSKLDPRYAYSNGTFNIYHNDMVKKSGDILSGVGTVVSACKLGYLAGSAAAGTATDADIFELYKECAGMAVNLSGSVTLSALMGPVLLADTFIQYMFTESLAMKEAEVQEMYVWFNEKYPGSGAPTYTRAGRSAADWRREIIRLIEENPQENSADILAAEVDAFCGAFWVLGSDELADVAAQCPKNIRRITDTDRKMRETITAAYKKQLYDVLDRTVMPSVRAYFNKQLLREARKSLAAAKKFYNQTISFDIFEADRTDAQGRKGEKAEALFGGYRCCFMPLSQEAAVNSWSSVLPKKNVGLHGEFTLIGHLTSGRPSCLAVFEPGADVTRDEPVLVVPFTIGEDNCVRIILEKTEPEVISDFCGIWYDEDGYELQVDTFADGKLGIYNFGWSRDWMLADYARMPKGSSVRIRGEEYPIEESAELIRLIAPKASTFTVPESSEYFAAVDETRTVLVLFFGGGAEVYTRTKPVEETLPAADPGTSFEKDPYAPLIPPGGDD